MDKRREAILEYIIAHGFASADELAVHVGFSPITVRRDLALLEQDKKIRRIHGGAIPGTLPEFATNIASRVSHNAEEKRVIAQFAATLIRPGEKLFLDTGSTCYYLAQVIQENLGLTIITQSLDNILVLKNKPGIKLICLGGILDEILDAFVGSLAETQLDSFFADKAFLGAATIDPQRGCFDDTVVEQRMKVQMNHHARESYMLLDSSKFGRLALHKSLSIEEVKAVITTTSVPPEQVKLLEAKGKRVYLAGPK
jgi:DeoR/GlpR family transcriptional regulator of sugar metabolism